MKKISLILVLMMGGLMASCGAETTADKNNTAATATRTSAPTATASSSPTLISENSLAAVKAMGPEAGIDNFDAAAVAAAGDAKFKAGVDYTVLSPTQPTSSDPGVVEVAEVFMYSCPHCFNLEPFVERFMQRKPIGVNFVRIPAQFNNVAKIHAAAYYAAEALGVVEQIHLPMFRTLHVEKKGLNNQAAIKKVFEANGVSGEDFDSTITSFDVDAKTRAGANLGLRYKIQSVPTLVINGKYTTSGTMAKSIDRLNEILDYLVAKELSER